MITTFMEKNFNYDEKYYSPIHLVKNHNHRNSEACDILLFEMSALPEIHVMHPQVYQISVPRDAKIIKDGKWLYTNKVIAIKEIDIEKHFDYGFIKEKFDYKNCSWALPLLAVDFNKWWDKKRYNYKKGSGSLALSCYKHFDEWFDKEKFNYKDASANLAIYCSEHFHKWFDKKKYNYKDSSWALARCCSQYFDKWFNPELFNFNYDSIRFLNENCQEHKDKYIKYMKHNV